MIIMIYNTCYIAPILSDIAAIIALLYSTAQYTSIELRGCDIVKLRYSKFGCYIAVI